MRCMKNITVKIPKNKLEKLQKLAIQYGLSVEKLASQVLENISSEIGLESWDNYSPQSKSSFVRGLADLKAGRVHTSL